VPHSLDARGLVCPLPLLRARAAMAALDPGDILIVLADDPEAPVDLAAFAADEGHAYRDERLVGGAWRFELVKHGASR
jgi:tRNA 2-thiouridine synthesizing protein A